MRRHKNLFNKEDEKKQSVPVIKPKKVLKSEGTEKTDFFTRNAKFFRINFEQMLVVSDCNRINVLTAREFNIIDVSA
jgi:hypothetical protein